MKRKVQKIDQVCGGYSKKSLMGNWYEERIANEQDIRKNPDARHMRESEGAICFVTHDNQIKPLPRTKRCPPWKTKCIIPDDKYREFRSLTKTNYDLKNIKNYYGLKDCRNIVKKIAPNVTRVENNPHMVQTFTSKKHNMLNEENFVRQIKQERPVVKRRTEFGSTLRRHDETHKRFYGMTDYQRTFSRPLKQTAKNVINNCTGLNDRFSGVNERKKENQGSKILSALTSEFYKRDQDPFEHGQGDPKDNTQVQRNWIPNVDKAIQVAKFNMAYNEKRNLANTVPAFQATMGNYRQNISQKLPYDIATSVPLGKGEYERRDKHMGIGQFRHMRTDITVIRNKTFATR